MLLIWNSPKPLITFILPGMKLCIRVLYFCWLYVVNSPILLAVPRAFRWPIMLQQKFVISSSETSVSTEVSNSFVYCASASRLCCENITDQLTCCSSSSMLFLLWSIFLVLELSIIESANKQFPHQEMRKSIHFLPHFHMLHVASPEIQNTGSIAGAGEGLFGKRL